VAGSASPLVENCTISESATIDGTADFNGGGAQFTTLSKLIFKNCIFSSNASGWIAGTVAIVESQPEFINCVFVDNTAGQYAGAVAIIRFSMALSTAYSRVVTTTIRPILMGNPLFICSSKYLISSNSPAIDHGTMTDAPLKDIQSQVRSQRNGIDIGVDEVL